MIKELKKEIERKKELRKNEELLLDIRKSFDSLNASIKEVSKKIEPPLSEISVKNIPDPVKEVAVTNLKDFPSEIKVSNIQDIKIPEQKEEISIKEASWLKKSLESLGEKIKSEIVQLKIKAIDSLNLDKYTKKNSPLAVRLVTQDGNSFYNAGGGGGNGGPDIVGLKDETETRINPATEDTLSSISNSVQAPTTIAHNKVTVTTAGTRVQFGTNTAKSITIKAIPTNTGTMYIGGSTVSSTNGFPLAAGDTVSFDISNTNVVWADSSVSGESVNFMSVN